MSSRTPANVSKQRRRLVRPSQRRSPSPVLDDTITFTVLGTDLSEDEDNPGLNPSTQYPAPDTEEEYIYDEAVDSSLDLLPTPRQPLKGIPIPTEIGRLPPSPVPDNLIIHVTYSTLLSKIGQGTGTAQESTLTLERLPLVLQQDLGLPLDRAYGPTLHMWACALIVHVWQVICLKYQAGITYNGGQSLSSLCASYFLAAWTIVVTSSSSPEWDMSQQECSTSDPSISAVSSDLFKGAVEYWERRVSQVGGGWKLKLYSALVKNIPDPDSSLPCRRNSIADSYSQILNDRGLVGLAGYILDQEIGRQRSQGPRTRLHALREESFEYEAVRKDVISVLVAIDPAILTALIDGQLSRKAEMPCQDVAKALDKVQRQQPQPGIYQNSLCDYQGISPTARQWDSVCDTITSYLSNSVAGDDLASEIDNIISPIEEWTRVATRKGLRRYMEERTWLEHESDCFCEHRRRELKFFVSQMRERIREQPSMDAPLDASVVEIGFSNNPPRRLRDHSHHRGSNYIMNLAEATFEYLYPGLFRIQQLVLLACFAPEHCWLGEIFVTLLTQGYTHKAGGFSHYPPGNSNGSSYRKVSPRLWDRYHARAVQDGYLVRLKAAREQAEQHRQQNSERERQDIQAQTRSDMLAQMFEALDGFMADL